jgi:hypothetical protein
LDSVGSDIFLGRKKEKNLWHQEFQSKMKSKHVSSNTFFTLHAV